MKAHILSRNAPKLRILNSARLLFSALTNGLKKGSPKRFFSSALAHEVRNPLTNINLAIDMLAFTSLDNDQRLYIDIIKRASFRINGLITELLAASEPSKTPADRQPIHQLLDEVLAMTDDRMRLKKISVRKDCIDP
jgi:signal transduction histidine kinase